MEAQASPAGSPFAVRRQKNLQKYRQHMQRKKTSTSTTYSSYGHPQQPTESDSNIVVEQELATGKNETVATAVGEVELGRKLQTPPASPLKIGAGKKVDPLDVVASPVSKGTPLPAPTEGFSLVVDGSPGLKRRSDIIKKLSKKKVNSHVLDSPCASADPQHQHNNDAGAAKKEEAKVMADSTNNSHELTPPTQELEVETVTAKKEVQGDATSNDDAEEKEQTENRDVATSCKEEQPEDPADNQPDELKDSKDNEVKEASNSFDLRSIHDFPTEPIQKSTEAIECSKDASWDTAKVFFNEYQGQTSSSSTSNIDSVNMFDTNGSTSWTVPETASFSRTFETNNDVFSSEEGFSSFDGEEKKEREASDQGISASEAQPTPDSPHSPMRRRSRMEVTNPLENPPINPVFGTRFPDDVDMGGFDEDNFKDVEDDVEEEVEDESPSRGDEDLLGPSKSNDDEDEANLWKNDTQLSKEERLQQYQSTTAKDGNDSSVCSSDTEQEDEEDESSEAEAEVEYMSHSEEEEKVFDDNNLDGPANKEKPAEEDLDMVEDAPVFSLAAEAAVAAEENTDMPFSEVEDQNKTNDSEVHVSVPVEEKTAMEVPEVEGQDKTDQLNGRFSEIEENRKLEKAEETIVFTAGMMNVDHANTLSLSQDATGSEESPAVDASTNSGSNGSLDGEKKDGSFDEIEDATSLVGVSLVPSFNNNNNGPPGTGANKSREGMPPRGANLNVPPPPPPPPPLSAKKKKKKKDKSDGSKKIPLIAPPPKEKFKKWEESKNRPLQHLAAVKEESIKVNKDLHGAAAGVISPRGDGGAEELACAAFANAFGLGELDVDPSKSCQTTTQAVISPVDAARSAALENAMKRATKCDSGGPSNQQSNFAPCVSLDAAKSLFEDDMEDNESFESSFSADGPSLTKMVNNKNNTDKRKNEPAWEQVDYLQKLTSPSLSMSPTSGAEVRDKAIDPGSPIIHDQKMAEKVALASYAAAMKFEEKYNSSHDDNESTGSKSNKVRKEELDASKDGEQAPSFFCGNGEIQAELEKIANSKEPTKELPSLFCGPEVQKKFENEFAEIVGTSFSRSGKDKAHDKFGYLKGGAFGPWKNALYASNSERVAFSSASMCSSGENIGLASSKEGNELVNLHMWLTKDVLNLEREPGLVSHADDVLKDDLKKILEEDEMLNTLCRLACDKVNQNIDNENEELAKRNPQLSPRKKMRPFSIGSLSMQKTSSVAAANFVSFMHRLSKASGIPSPFGEDNPFLLDLVSTSIQGIPSPQARSGCSNMQKLVFGQCPADVVTKFFFDVCGGCEGVAGAPVEIKNSGGSSFDMIEACRAANPSPTRKSKNPFFREVSNSPLASTGDKKFIVPDEHPSPFERAMETNPKLLASILDFLGDPVAVCRVKMLNSTCKEYIANNEQVLVRDAVRLGGMSMNVRPAFWLWVTLEKCGQNPISNLHESADGSDELRNLEREGLEGKWHHVIQRDVARSFGNMPPHKTGARLRTDSIVRALVTWGRNRIMKRGVKGDGNPPSNQASLGSESDAEASQAPTDTVSDWGGVSPVASFAGNNTGGGGQDGGDHDRNNQKDDQDSKSRRKSQDSSQSVATELLVLSGNALTDEMKTDLQNKLGFILHALAATHEDVGYCQGMDYVVAHLLRILQDTVRWRAARGTLPSCILTAPDVVSLPDFDADSLSQKVEEVDSSLVVEETVFLVMNTLFTTYNLQHMYWPELRCLKTCCRVFERLIQIKLPVLADHFEHHELNVGLFALGWFQTLFLYLPSMPSATVCHMWDIWLVERSFKIFFRVGTAILFLSQPILLNHELEGMMTYLNTFPDATLLNPDILIACALQIKVTNKMLMEIEAEVSGCS